MIRITQGLLSVSIFLVTTACTVLPTIELTKISSPTDLKGDEIDTFALQKSVIKIAQSGTKTVSGKDIPTLEVSSAPQEFMDFKLGIRRADSFGVKTNINLTKFANTELIKEAGTEVVDTRADLIGKIGSIITKIIPVVFTIDPGDLNPNSLPIVVDTLVLLETNKIGREKSSSAIEEGHGASITFGAVPVDAVETKSLPASKVGSSLVYSACRSAEISFKFMGEKYAKTVKVSDPRYLQRVSLPLNGKVSFHTECGVSVESNKDTGVASNASIVDALVVQAKAIKDAIDAAKK